MSTDAEPVSATPGVGSATVGKIINHRNGMFLGTYGPGGQAPGLAITLFGKGWNYEQNWEFIPVEGGYYVIKLATPPGAAPVAMARAKNPYPQDPVWTLYGDPAAVTES